ncbi:ERI1 exoribonuclease 2 [Scomber japonicus]|uniref:ERI1 exoribonuclease 2 n=1 Tax=Scomber japonicus TaxID=13676 RepID=UPI0023067DB8|nr:ERI1 exoribonuclease 2 [Scomber japonicus]
MATKKLAKELGLLRQRSQSSGKKPMVLNQIFSYLIVIDFESTCWREKNNYTQEIIEFPAVLLNTSTGEIESEFHTYVQPQERPVLSEFCTELTGITQMQVEAGIPLQICLSRFSRWLQNLQLQMGVVFSNRQQKCSAPSASQKLCTFLTWSDWDLGVCLQYECKRKQIHKPDVLNSWIDLRSTYRLFYNRKPKGLNGALQDLGIQFSGREHSGVDDARNTAQLAARMMRDGCVMKITRSLDRTPPTVKPMFGNSACPAHKTEKPNTNKEENTNTTNKPSSSKIPLKSGQIKSCPNSNTKILTTEENSSSVQSLVSPKTLLNGATTPLWGRNRKSSSGSVGLTNISSSVMTKCPSPFNNNHDSSSSSSLVMCSTTIDFFSHLPQHNQTSKTTTAGFMRKEEVVELLVEGEDRCGSYDDVVLDGDDASVETDREFEYMADFDGMCYVSDEPDDSHSRAGRVTLRDDVRETVSAGSKTQRIETTEASTTSHINVSGQLNKTRQHSTISEPEAYFAVPQTVIWSSKSKQQKSRMRAPLPQEKPAVSHDNSKMNTPSMFRLNPFVPEQTSTPHTSFTRPKATVTQHTMKYKETPKSSFSIYTDSVKQDAAPSSLNFSKNVLSSLSTNTFSSSIHQSSIPVNVQGKTSTPNISFVKPNATITQYKKHKETPKSSFSIFTDSAKKDAAPSSLNFSKNVLSSLSTNTFSTSINRSSNPVNVTEKTSTSITSFAKPKTTITQHTKQKETPKSSFSIFADSAKQDTASSSLNFSKNVFSSLSTSTFSSSINRSSVPATMRGRGPGGGGKITSPLCGCGRRAKRQVVSNGGPNHGRGFYCCAVRRSGSGNRIQKGCEFFKWESALMKSSSVVSPAVRSSVSLCQINSTVSCRPPQSSSLRKSY